MLGLESLKGTVFLCILKTEELPTVSASGTIVKSAEIIWCFLPWALCSPEVPISLLCLQLELLFRVNTKRCTADCRNRGRTTEGAAPFRWWFDINSSFISENLSLLLSLQHDLVGEFVLHNTWTKIFLKISTKDQEARGIVFSTFVYPQTASHCFWASYAVCFVLRTCDLVDNAWVTFI